MSNLQAQQYVNKKNKKVMNPQYYLVPIPTPNTAPHFAHYIQFNGWLKRTAVFKVTSIKGSPS